MEKAQCKRCNKVIEGYTKNHAEFLLDQHNLTHKREEEEEKQYGNKRSKK